MIKANNDDVKESHPLYTLVVIFSFIIIICSSSTSAETRFVDDNNRDYVESRITVESHFRNNDTYFVNYAEDGNEYRVNSSQKLGVRIVDGIGMYVIELDPYVSQKITIVDDYTLNFKVENNPNNPYRNSRIPLRLCMSNNSVRNANRFETDIPYCDSDKEYYVGNIKIGSDYTVRLNNNIRDTTNLIWWLGEDDLDGTYGAGGGLPICGGITTSVSTNISNGNVSFTFQYRAAAYYIYYSAGCTANNLVWQYKQEGSGSFIVVPINNNSGALDCTGSNCYQSSPVWENLYTRIVSCDVVGNHTLRSVLTGTVNGKAKTVYSPWKNIECIPTPSPIDVEDVIWLTLFVVGLMIATGLIIKFKKGDQNEDSS